MIASLPCDCVADLELMSNDKGYITCPWCSADFLVDDFNEWFSGFNAGIWLQRPPTPMVRTQLGRVLEFAGRCGCGLVLARERGEKEKVHIDGDVEVARN